MEARIDLIKIDAAHCFCCGELFDKKRRKTDHHAIQKILKPKRNVLLPVCSFCHKKVSGYHIQSMPNFKNIKGFIKNLEQFLESNKPIIERYDIEQEAENEN
jgi:hypothetical protein